MIGELERLWRERKSIRGFRPDPVPREQLVEMFAAAQRAPSWCNVQPWRVAITDPPKTAALAAEMQAAAKSGLPRAEVPFPIDYPPPYQQHRIACGAALYTEMGVSREDKLGRYDAWLRNYAFFDAPHVAIVACDKRLGPYVYVDVGVWLGYVLTAAAALGIATCPMASVAAYPDVLRRELPIGADDVILFGLALGYPDDAVPANRTRTSREPVESNVMFVVG
ncbi:MAG: nitroreductase [Kofleriaceae bacterium]